MSSADLERVRRSAAAWIAVAVAGSLMAGCQAAEQVEVDRSTRIIAFQGRTMANFIGETGLTPSNFYPITSGRVFVIDGPSVVSSSGGYSNATAWRLLIQTEPNERGATADGWTIVGTTRTGPCQLLPI